MPPGVRFPGGFAEKRLFTFSETRPSSPRVSRSRAAYIHVQRVGGHDAYEISVTFAGFRDAGMNEG